MAPLHDSSLSVRLDPSPTVLLVDDEPMVRSIIARWLALGGLHVIEAGSAEEALAVFPTLPQVAAVVTDTFMPGGMSGVELIHRIRALRATQPILRISGKAPDDFEGAPPPEDVPCLPKPFQVTDLLHQVGKLLSTPTRMPDQRTGKRTYAKGVAQAHTDEGEKGHLLKRA